MFVLQSMWLFPNRNVYSSIRIGALRWLGCSMERNAWRSCTEDFLTYMFTVLFTLAGCVGWVAQWKEMIEDPAQKIGRPRQLHTGGFPSRLCSAWWSEIIEFEEIVRAYNIVRRYNTVWFVMDFVKYWFGLILYWKTAKAAEEMKKPPHQLRWFFLIRILYNLMN